MLITRLNSKQGGFSLVEVTIAGVIFALAIGGIYASISSIEKPATGSPEALGAALCGQKFLSELRASIDQRDWSLVSSQLAPGVNKPAPNCVQNGVTYQLRYTVVNSGAARKATVTVTW